MHLPPFLDNIGERVLLPSIGPGGALSSDNACQRMVATRRRPTHERQVSGLATGILSSWILAAQSPTVQ